MRVKQLLSMAVAAAALAGAAAPAAADWRDDWKAFAAKTNDPDHARWAQLIASPEARKLEAEWRAFRGYDATSLLEKADVPEELRPGLVITKANVGSVPGLDKFLPPFWKERLTSGWFPIQQIRIVPTSHYYMSQQMLEATKANKPNEFAVNEKGELIASDRSLGMITRAGLPFTSPKDGLQLNWLQTAHGVGTDDLYFNPITIVACDKANRAERTYRGQLWWRRMAGRTEESPLGQITAFKGAQEAGALVFTEPRDVRGLAGVRIRYPEADRDDDFKVFIPTLRRTRVLAGSNGQDPLAAGVEMAWDEWRSHWVKTDARKFDYVLAGEGFVLAMPEVGFVYDPLKLAPDNCTAQSVELELRPVWILELKDKTGNYQYSRQRLYIDKELYYTQFKEMYDRRGKLLRVWDDARAFDPATGKALWRNAVVANIDSQRATTVQMNTDWVGRKQMNNSLFNIDQLRERR